MIKEAHALTPKRTEYGKAIRKDYERHIIHEKRKNMTYIGIRDGELCGCLTSVEKDNYILIWEE